MIQKRCESILSKSMEILELYWGRICQCQADPSVRLGTPCYSPFDATLAVCPTLYCIAVLRWCYRSLFINDYRPVCKRLLVSGANDYSFRMQTTIGAYMKPLLVWGQMTRTVSLCSLSLPSTLSGKNFVSLRDVRGEVRDRSQFPRHRVFAFFSCWSSFLS